MPGSCESSKAGTSGWAKPTDGWSAKLRTPPRCKGRSHMNNAGEPNKERFPDLVKACEDFAIKECWDYVKHWPVAENFALCQRTKDVCIDLLLAETRENNKMTKRDVLKALNAADTAKDTLCVMFKVAESQNYISKKRLSYIQGQLKNIGAIIGGCQRWVSETWRDKSPHEYSDSG